MQNLHFITHLSREAQKAFSERISLIDRIKNCPITHLSSFQERITFIKAENNQRINNRTNNNTNRPTAIFVIDPKLPANTKTQKEETYYRLASVLLKSVKGYCIRYTSPHYTLNPNRVDREAMDLDRAIGRIQTRKVGLEFYKRITPHIRHFPNNLPWAIRTMLTSPESITDIRELIIAGGTSERTLHRVIEHSELHSATRFLEIARFLHALPFMLIEDLRNREESIENMLGSYYGGQLSILYDKITNVNVGSSWRKLNISQLTVREVLMDLEKFLYG